MSDQSAQFSLFRDCIAQQFISRQQTATADTSELDDFIDFLADDTWTSLPPALQNATYQSRTQVPEADEVNLGSIVSPTFSDTLVSYGIVCDVEEAIKFVRKVVEQYRAEACAPPPVWSTTRTTECEICEREVPLTYHHLIPKSVHDKVLKKGWHDEIMLNSVAWLCRYMVWLSAWQGIDRLDLPLRPCHSMVHHVEPNEVLAKEYYTVELLLQREDIQKWQTYASKQRWGTRPKKSYKPPV